jgi:hypothetical protein
MMQQSFNTHAGQECCLSSGSPRQDVTRPDSRFPGAITGGLCLLLFVSYDGILLLRGAKLSEVRSGLENEEAQRKIPN